MRRLIALALFTLFITPLARADDKPKAEETAAGDLAKFQGDWAGLVGPSQNIPVVVTIKKNKLTLSLEAQGQTIEVEGEIKIDEKASPKTIDWLNFKSPAGDELPNNLGIYKFEDDKLICCNGGPGNDRPTEFKAGDGGRPSLLTLTRVKNDKADAPKGDLAKFQGKWKTKHRDLDISLSIEGNKVSATYTNEEGKALKLDGELVLNEETKLKSIDFVKFKNPNGEDMGDNLGIYSIEKDAITICLGGAGNARPTEFKGGDESPMLITLERGK